jgi:hypothetical protein
MNTETPLCIENVKIVMDGLASINYNKQSYEQNTLSLFKTSYNGMNFIKNDYKLFRQAIGMWLNIIEEQILNITNDDDYKILESQSVCGKGMEWVHVLCMIKEAYNSE